jgi:hypothetical protein
MSSNYINLPLEGGGGGGGGVSSLNTLTGALTLVAGPSITITALGNVITISSSALPTALISLNGSTFANQTLTVGTSGTDFAIVDTAPGTHTFNLPTASASVRGALSSSDWSTFNSKQPTGNYITALTGDATALGPGSAALTLATVNSNIGSFGTASQSSQFTVNAKGLITAASSISIQIAESQVTNLVSDLAGKQPTGNYITALTGDATASGPGSAALTLATVNSNIGSFGSTSQTLSLTTNAKGLITAVSATSIQIAESQVTNLVSDLAGKQPTGNYITALTSDVSASGPGSATATVNSVGGKTSAQIATSVNDTIAATNLNTPSTIVKRDASGNFSAGTITASLSGNATNVTGIVAIANGGTNSSTAPTARVALGVESRTAFSNTNVVLSSTDKYAAQTGTMTASRTVTLPLASSVNAGYILYIGDESGTLSFTNSLVVTRSGSDLINGANTLTLVTPNAIANFVSDGSSKWTIDIRGVTRGGTGVTATPTNGQLLIGNGTGYTVSTLTAGNNIQITNASGSITIASTGVNTDGGGAFSNYAASQFVNGGTA